MQEETCITLRDNTERQETLDVGANVLTGANAEEVLKAPRQILSRRDGWTNPFGIFLLASCGYRLVDQKIDFWENHWKKLPLMIKNGGAMMLIAKIF